MLRRRWLARAAMVLLPLVLAVVLATPLWAGERLSAEEAGGHIGQQATVCGTVVDSRWARGSKGQPTFLNIGKPYPNHLFTVVIWSEYRAKFGSPERDLLRKNVCVEGRIREYRGKPEIEVREPKQMSLQ